MQSEESWTIRLLLQTSVIGVAISLLVSGLTVDLWTGSSFCGVFVVQCVSPGRKRQYDLQPLTVLSSCLTTLTASRWVTALHCWRKYDDMLSLFNTGNMADGETDRIAV